MAGCPAKTRVAAHPYSLVCPPKNSEKLGKRSSMQDDILPRYYFLLWMHEAYRIPQTKVKNEGLQAALRLTDVRVCRKWQRCDATAELLLFR